MKFYRGGKRGPGVERFFYASEATIRCPLSPFQTDIEAVEGYDDRLLLLLGDDLAAAAEEHRLDLPLLFRKAHRGVYPAGRKADEPCPVCGTPLANLGYRAWRDRPLGPSDELEPGEQEVHTLFEENGSHRHARTGERLWAKKREAISWALEEARVSKAAAE